MAGGGNGSFSQASKDLMSAAMKGNTNGLGNTGGRVNKGKKKPPRTKEHSANASAANKGNTNAKGNKGKVRTDEHKAAMSAAMKEYWRLCKEASKLEKLNSVI